MDNSITLKFKSTGLQRIISINFVNKPNKVFINDNETSFYSEELNDTNYIIYSNYTIQINSINDIVKLVWDYSLTNCSYMFKGLTNLKNIDFSDFDFSFVNNMEQMFYNCSNLESINFNNGPNKIKVRSMSYMFYNCIKITSLNLTNFDTSLVTSMSYMLCNCTSLNNLILGEFKNTITTNMKSLFQSCVSLKSLDLKHFYTPKAEIMWDLFNNAKSLTSLDLSSFDTSMVTDMESMFDGCSKLKALNLSHFKTSNCRWMNKMFRNCQNLKYLDFRQINTNSLSTMTQMFYGCKSLIYINISSINNEISTNEMFYYTSGNFSYCINNFNNIPTIKTLLNGLPKTKNNCTYFEFILDEEDIEEKNENQEKDNEIEKIEEEKISESEEKELENFEKINRNEEEEIYIEEEQEKETINGKNEDTKGKEENINLEEEYNMEEKDDGIFKDENTKEIEDEIKKIEKEKMEKEDIRENNDDIYEEENMKEMEIEIEVKEKEKEKNDDIFENENIKEIEELINKIEEEEKIKEEKKVKENILLKDDAIFEEEDIKEKEVESQLEEKEENIEKDNEENLNTEEKKNIKEKDDNIFVDENLNDIEEEEKIREKRDNIFEEENIKETEDEINEKEKEKIGAIFEDDYIKELEDEIQMKDEEEEILKEEKKENERYIKEKEIDEEKIEKEEKHIKEKKEVAFEIENIEEIENEICKKEEEEKKEKEKQKEILNEQEDENSKNIEEKEKGAEKEQEKKQEDKVCTKEYPYKNNDNTCVEKCTINDLVERNCILNYTLIINENTTIIDKEQDKLNNVKEELINNNFNTSNIDQGEDVIIKNEETGVTISITSSENQKNSRDKNVTSINLGECEDKLKEKYQIPKDEALYILKIDIEQKGFELPKIEYEVYYPLNNSNLVKLDLEVCKDTKIEIIYPSEIDENLDILNTSSGYYNDICYTFTSENGTDISLNDRKNQFINNNKTKCEESCDFKEYDNINKKVVCSCEVKMNLPLIKDISFDKKKLYDKFTDINNIGNFKLLKCYFVLFTIKGIKNNIGCFIAIPILILYFICLIVFCKKDYKEIKISINEIIFAKNMRNKLKQRRKKNNSNLNLIKNRKQIAKNGKKSIVSNKDFIEQNEKIATQDTKILKNVVNNRKKRIKKNVIKNKNIAKNQTSKFIVDNTHKKIDNHFSNNVSNPIKKVNKVKKPRKSAENNSKKKLIMLETANNIESELIHKITKMNKAEKIKAINDILRYNDSELNELEYNVALSADKRSFIAYYLSLLKELNLLILSFWPNNNDYNSRIVKIFLFFFNFVLSLTINAFFFDDNTLHQINEDGGNFNFIYQIPQMIYSSIISIILDTLIKFLALSQQYIIKIKQNKNYLMKKKESKIFDCLHYKFVLFFILSFLLLLFFWYYLSCFCAIYKNTQIHLLKDSVISFGFSLLSPFGYYLIPGIFRIPSLKSKNRKCLYTISQLIQALM